VVGNAVPPSLNSAFDTNAQRYFGDGTAVANGFHDLSTSANADQEAVAYLKGLAYANHLLNTQPTPPGALQNVKRWKEALKNAGSFPENTELREHTLSKFTEVKDELSPAAASLRRVSRILRTVSRRTPPAPPPQRAEGQPPPLPPDPRR